MVEHSTLPKAQDVEPWPGCTPTVYSAPVADLLSPANPIERAFGDVHDCCTRNHQRQCFPDLVAEVEDHVHLNGPWKYQRSDRYDEPAITVATPEIAAEAHA